MLKQKRCVKICDKDKIRNSKKEKCEKLFKYIIFIA